MRRVVLGLSDGVDSCVSAYLLKQQGFDVLGVYMDIGGEEQLDNARKNAIEAGIAFEAVRVDAEMDALVKRPFVEAYIHGRTPMPCTLCNRNVKLPALFETAKRFGADRIATGHYVRSDGKHLFMGNKDCDQSFMLSRLTPEQVERLMLPLGEMDKTEVRKMATDLGFSCASRPDSRENCFIRDKSYIAYIQERCGDMLRGEGDVTFEGRVIGRHEGIYRYTVGQRWKNDIGDRRAYVKSINAAANTVELCLWEELFTNRVVLSELSFISGAPPNSEFSASIRVRHTRWETPACRVRIKGDCAFAETETPLRAPAPGQSAALYAGEMLLGGGTVEKD
ncbi:MAG: argininosuccinate synthase [Clostridiales bacterium]|nr:argininosuccinate synthase [Clostridiales bacterium]